MTLGKLKRPKVHVSFGKAEGGGRASVSRRGEARPGRADVGRADVEPHVATMGQCHAKSAGSNGVS